MGAPRVAFERHEPPHSRMEFVEVLRCRRIMYIIENLDAFNFDLTETLIHRVHRGVVDGWIVVAVADRDIDRRRRQAVPQRIRSRTRFAFLRAGAAASGTIALVCGDLPLRSHWFTTPAADQRRGPRPLWLSRCAAPARWLWRPSPTLSNTGPDASGLTRSGARWVPRRVVRVGMLRPPRRWTSSPPSRTF